jgi:hypothetical protein
VKRRLLQTSVIACALATACALGGPGVASGQRPPSRLFADGFERGLSAWQVQAPAGAVTPVSRSVFSGRRAARFVVRAGERDPSTRSSRAEVYLTKPDFRAGTTIYVGDSIRLGHSFVDTDRFQSWRIVQQLHEVGLIRPPGLAVFVDPGPRFGLRSGTSRPSFWNGPELRRGRWYRLVYGVHLSRDPAQGWVRVWLDGQPQILTNGKFEMQGTTIHAAAAFLKLGMYRSPYFRDTSVVYHDRVLVSRTLSGAL